MQGRCASSEEMGTGWIKVSGGRSSIGETKPGIDGTARHGAEDTLVILEVAIYVTADPNAGLEARDDIMKQRQCVLNVG